MTHANKSVAVVDGNRINVHARKSEVLGARPVRMQSYRLQPRQRHGQNMPGACCCRVFMLLTSQCTGHVVCHVPSRAPHSSFPPLFFTPNRRAKKLGVVKEVGHLNETQFAHVGSMGAQLENATLSDEEATLLLRPEASPFSLTSLADVSDTVFKMLASTVPSLCGLFICP